MDWLNQFLDATVVYSFDHSGFERHCPEKLPKVDLSGLNGIITGASSGIGLATAESLIDQKMQCILVGRDLSKLEEAFKQNSQATPLLYSLDMADLHNVYSFAKNEVKTPIDLIVHDAGSMPLTLEITKEGYEQMFASQVLGPYILTKALVELGKLHPRAKIVFVSSGGMYLQKLDLSDLLFQKHAYNKYTGYANAKRAQVILSELFAEKYPQYLFSSMHPGWVDTPGVRHSMPMFQKMLGKRLRSFEEGADTILWLATQTNYPNGKFWFDRKQAKTTFFGFNDSNDTEKEQLWDYCETAYKLVSQ